jgi:hypothetical protein
VFDHWYKNRCPTLMVHLKVFNFIGKLLALPVNDRLG